MSPVVKVCMDCELYIKGLVRYLTQSEELQEVLPDVLQWTCSNLRLEEDKVAAWVQEVAVELAEEEEASHTHTDIQGVSEQSQDSTPSPDESDGRAKAKRKEGRERENALD